MMAVSVTDLRRNAMQHCKMLCGSDGQLHTAWLVLFKLIAFRHLNYPRGVDRNVCQEGDAVVTTRNATLVLDQMATGRTEYGQFNSEAFQAIQSLYWKEE